MTQNNKVPTIRLKSHLSVENGWHSMKSLTYGEVTEVIKELLAYRNSSHPLQQVLDKFEEKK